MVTVHVIAGIVPFLMTDDALTVSDVPDGESKVTPYIAGVAPFLMTDYALTVPDLPDGFSALGWDSSFTDDGLCTDCARCA